MKTASIVSVLLAMAVSASAMQNIVTYQGQLAKSGYPYSGNAFFKFSLLTNGATIWTHDGSAGPQPTGVVTARVSLGFYTVYLGDPNVTTGLPLSVFNLADQVVIRVWVATTGDVGFTQLTPERPVTAAAMAINAGAVGGLLRKQIMEKWSNVIVVAKGGGDFTSVQSAINYGTTLPDHVTVFVCPGVYSENVTCMGNVDIIGASREGTVISVTNGIGIQANGVSGIRIQDLSVLAHPTASGPGISLRTSDVFLDRLTVETMANGAHGVFVSSCSPHIDDVRAFTSGGSADGLVISGGSASPRVDDIEVETKGPFARGVVAQSNAMPILNNVTITTRGEGSHGFLCNTLADPKVDNLTVQTHGPRAVGVQVIGEGSGGGWYNNSEIRTYEADSHGIYLETCHPTFENFSVVTFGPSNSAGVVVVGCKEYWNPQFYDGTIHIFSYDSAGIYCFDSTARFFHVNIDIDCARDDYSPFQPFPMGVGPGCGVVSEIESLPYLNNCIIQMGRFNFAPSAFASGGMMGGPPTHLKLYNCTCRDQVGSGPRWLGYSIDIDRLAFPAVVCSLHAAHNRLRTPGLSNLGYPWIPAGDPTQFNMIIVGAMDAQGNLPDMGL